ncbi:MAG: PA2779 family protein [Chromatiales bacterium]|jgi:hypothetical protein
MKTRHSQRVGAAVLSAALLMGGQVMPAAADIVGTDRAVAAQERRAQSERLQSLLSREDVARELERYGVDPAEARERVASLTDAELAQVGPRLEQLPAGAGVVEVIGVVFVVLLILELVGVTDVFTGV